MKRRAHKRGKTKSTVSIAAFPEHVLCNIFAGLPSDEQRLVLPLVCLRWRDAVFSAGGQVFQDISIPSSSPSSLLAAREWVERNIQNGVLTYPIKVALIEQEESHDANYGQDIPALLQALSGTLQGLELRLMAQQPTAVFQCWQALSRLQSLKIGEGFVVMSSEEFNDGLRSLRCLENLEITGNECPNEVFPPAIYELTGLTCLALNNCNLGELLQDFSKLTRLNSFSAMQTCMKRAPGMFPAALGLLPSLQVLQISKMFSFYDSSSGIVPLQSLALQPREGHWRYMTNLTTLRWLCQESFLMAQPLPHPLRYLVNLRELDLAYIKDMDQMGVWGQPLLAELTKLETLKLMFCHITGIPAALASLCSLQSLVVSSSESPLAPGSFQHLTGLTALTCLRICQCRMKRVPESVWSLTSLRCLDLCENLIDRVSPSVSQLTGLTELDLRHNSIFPEVPQCLAALTQLRKLNLMFNKAAKVPEYMYMMGVTSPKLPIRADSIKWLLNFPNLISVSLDVSKEEAKEKELKKLFKDLRAQHKGQEVLQIRTAKRDAHMRIEFQDWE